MDHGPVLDEIYQGPELDEIHPNPVEGETPQSYAPPDIYQGPEAPPGVRAQVDGASPKAAVRAAPPRSLGRETVLSRHLGAFLIVASVLYLLSQALWNAFLVGGTVKLTEVQDRFAAITGMAPPEGFLEAGAFRFVGREFLWFIETSASVPRLVALYHRGVLAPQMSKEQMVLDLKGWLDQVDLPMKSVERRKGLLGSSRAVMQIYRIGPEEGRSVAYAALAGFDTINERPAVLLLAAPHNEFDKLRRSFMQ